MLAAERDLDISPGAGVLLTWVALSVASLLWPVCVCVRSLQRTRGDWLVHILSD